MGCVCDEVKSRTIQAVKQAWQNMVPVSVGAGAGTRTGSWRTAG